MAVSGGRDVLGERAHHPERVLEPIPPRHLRDERRGGRRRRYLEHAVATVDPSRRTVGARERRIAAPLVAEQTRAGEDVQRLLGVSALRSWARTRRSTAGSRRSGRNEGRPRQTRSVRTRTRRPVRRGDARPAASAQRPDRRGHVHRSGAHAAADPRHHRPTDRALGVALRGVRKRRAADHRAGRAAGAVTDQPRAVPRRGVPAPL